MQNIKTINGNVLRQEGKIRRTMDNLMTIITMKLKNDNN